MTYHIPITDSDLHAYADDQLTPNRRREVEEYIRNHPEAAIQVDEYQRLNKGMHELYDPVLDESLPPQLLIKHSPFQQVWRAAAVMAWLGLGSILGWQLHPDSIVMAEREPTRFHLVQPAAFAHSVYATEFRHPVEVTANQQEHLVSWLSKRMNTRVNAPALNKLGFELIGGRLLPSTNRMAAQFMYQREDGTRITLYTRHNSWQKNITAFRYSKQGEMAILYWIDGPMGYAIVGNIKKTELLKLSKEIYLQLSYKATEMSYASSDRFP